MGLGGDNRSTCQSTVTDLRALPSLLILFFLAHMQMALGLQSRPDSYQMLPSDQFGQFRHRCLRRSSSHLVGKIISVGCCGDGDDKASACKNLLKKNSDVASTLDGFWLTL